MTREEALELVRSRVPKVNLVKHMIASGACMRALAERLGQDPDRWELAGLLHDLDLGEVGDDYSRHGLRTVEMLRELGFDDEEILGAILAHAEKKPLETLMDKALWAVDPTTGFLVACALMHPERKLAALDLGFIKRRFKEKRFAAGASREQMRSAEENLGLPLDDFLLLCRDAMASVSAELGL